MRYLGFAGDSYYPEGGFEDFIGFFDSIDKFNLAVEDKARKGRNKCDWWHLIDANTAEVILGNGDSLERLTEDIQKTLKEQKQ